MMPMSLLLNAGSVMAPQPSLKTSATKVEGDDEAIEPAILIGGVKNCALPSPGRSAAAPNASASAKERRLVIDEPPRGSRRPRLRAKRGSKRRLRRAPYAFLTACPTY